MKTFYGTLIGIVALLIVVPLAAAGDRTFPSWDKQINTPERFKVLGDFADAAVLDRETGLVWEQSPSTSNFTWVDALTHCYFLEVGGRKGWRLPTIEELASLVNTSNSSPALPTGHPFALPKSVQETGYYWSATTDANINSNAYLVSFVSGDLNIFTKTFTTHLWCVRYGQGIDVGGSARE
jgi:uncharacterized protein DUF1566